MKTKASRVVGLLGAGMIAMGLITGITRSELSASAAKQEKAGAEKKEPAKKDADKPAGAEATSAAAPVVNAKDVQSLDAIVAAIYDVISGPAGARDWNRFRAQRPI